MSNSDEMDFITIDFETATSKWDSPCEIGLTIVKEGMIVETLEWLIKPCYPKFDYYNVLIHGIKPEHVANSPEFDELWEELHPIVENQFLIAHNAGFDMGVLRKTLETYGIPYPNLQYACSVVFSRKIWAGLKKYDLKSLCNIHGISFHHHRAGADSRATAALAIKAFEEAQIETIADFEEKLNIIPGSIYEGGHKPSTQKKTKKPKTKNPL